MQRPEEFVRDARDTAHAGALDIDQGHLVHGGKTLDRHFGFWLGRDRGAAGVRFEGVSDPDGNAARDRGKHRVRMNDFRAEIGQL